jgi:hypothetical protein
MNKLDIFASMTAWFDRWHSSSLAGLAIRALLGTGSLKEQLEKLKAGKCSPH